MDFCQVKERETKKGVVEVYPDFKVDDSEDLMVRGGKFYAVWNEKKGLWSTNEYDLVKLVDAEIRAHKVEENQYIEEHRRYLSNWSSNTWNQFRLYCATLPSSDQWLDSTITFKNTKVAKADKVSKRLPYDLAEGDISAYDELIGVLYAPEERAKLEWALGAILSGDSRFIQKFLVLYGAGGKGKSTWIDIVEKMLVGYTAPFTAADLVGENNQFALAAFKNNPLVAINHDGDLSKVRDNSKLNSVVAHEKQEVNEKHKTPYEMLIQSFLIVGTNKPVRITDAKSGLVRRVIDVKPTGDTLSPTKYRKLTAQIEFELGAIAWHCLQVYKEMGKDYYSTYVPIDMMMQTDVFFNYIENYYDTFSEQDGATLKQAFDMWKLYVDEAQLEYKMPLYKFREELKNYFDTFEERPMINGIRVRNWYGGFNASRFKYPLAKEEKVTASDFALVLEHTSSLFDIEMAKAPAQYSRVNEQGNSQPIKFWTNSLKINSQTGKEYTPRADQVCSTVLSDLDTAVEHYVKVPMHHIVIDFDLTDSFGVKSRERNLEEASHWPPTYAELSKSGNGVHLHYYYDGPVEDLSHHYADGIEIKVFTGDTSLRRRLSYCNNIPIATINSGLPLKEKKVLDPNVVATEKGLRTSIEKALHKQVHQGTKSNMDFIHHVLTNAYRDGLQYDVTDMRPRIIAFASKSTNQAHTCLKMIATMQFKSEDVDETGTPNVPEEEIPTIFDVEVFPNLFVICWKYTGSDTVVKMVNPTAQAVEQLLTHKLIGFNNRNYDNHILYAAMLGWNNQQLYELSQRLIGNSPNATFREAYSLSYTDIFDFAAKKQTLKKWEIELEGNHLESGHPWDQSVPPELVDKIVEYCANDVNEQDRVFIHLRADFVARQILAELSGLSVNAKTQQHAAKIVFGDDRKPQGKFKYRNLSEQFDGYKYEYNEVSKRMTSTYRGEDIGEGGLVRAKIGMWNDVAVLDIESMHPTSIEILDLFGEYTKNFSTIKDARVAIKDGNFDAVRQMFGGKLAPYLTDDEMAEALSYALKIIINIVYGLTAASFDNAFRDPRNVDNIVAKIGALFMVDLMYAVEEMGFPVIHIKTDSIKIPGATPEIIEFIQAYGRSFGYKFVHEATYAKMCLVNDAVYVAKVAWAVKAKKIGTWEVVGAQFAHPYVLKKLFTNEPITFKDKCEARSVTTALYLDFEGEDVPMALGEEQKQFIGKTGLFCPILPGKGGGTLLREKEGKFAAAPSTSGFRWLEAETVKTLGKEKDIDESYFRILVDKAIDNISKHGDFEQFRAA